MSCSSHPTWYHDAEDCPYCASQRAGEQNLYIMGFLEGAEFQRALSSGARVQIEDARRAFRNANSYPEGRGTFNPDTDIPDCRPKR